jgi:hypothetical protein
MNVSRLLLLTSLALAAFRPAHAQIAVDLTLKRHLFLVHEPVVATVTLTNMSGRDIELKDTPELQWFGFQVNGPDEAVVGPRNPDYRLDPLPLRAGETVRKTVNLNELYTFGDYGTFKIRATIHYAPMRRYFVSKPVQIEQTGGKVLWRQTAGVPDGLRNAGRFHVFSLLSHQRDGYRYLYVSVEDRDDGTVFCTTQLARFVDGTPVQAEFDAGNNLYVLQLVGLRAYSLTKIGVNGEFMGQTAYTAPKTRPTLRKLADGTLQIVGGRKDTPVAQVPTNTPTKLSDRPAGLPQ